MCQACGQILQLGAEASSDILEGILRVPIEKALNPLDKAQFVTIIRRIARDLRGEASPVELEAAQKAAESLDANWVEMTGKQRADKLKEVEKILLATTDKLLPSLQVVFAAAADQIIPPTRKRVVAEFELGIKSTLTKRDEATSNILQASEAVFVRNNYGDLATKLTTKAKNIVAAGLEAGLGREDITADLVTTMKSAKRPDAYWGMIATVFSNRARNFTQVHAFDEAGIKAYLWWSVIDAVTTETCRFLHGREFQVSKAVKRIADVQAGEPEDIVQSMPWIQEGKNDDGQDILYYKSGEEKVTVAVVAKAGYGENDRIGEYTQAMATEALAKAGIMMPPGHGSCRSTVLPAI